MSIGVIRARRLIGCLLLICLATVAPSYAEEVDPLAGSAQSADPTQADFVPDDEQMIGVPLQTVSESVAEVDSARLNNQAGTLVKRPTTADRVVEGAQLVGGFDMTPYGVPIHVPRVVITHRIYGHGLLVRVESAHIGTLGAPVCNFRIDYQNRWGKTIYSTEKGPTRWSCVTNTQFMSRRSRDFKVRAGVLCARLFSNGVFVGEQCHSVHP